MIKYIGLLAVLLFTINSINATTIAPFENLGVMTQNTAYVVKATVVSNYASEENGSIRPISRLSIVSSIKGDLQVGEQITMQNYKLSINGLEREFWGDLYLKEGETYLLFMEMMNTGHYQTTMLSYAAFEEKIREGNKVLVPFGLGTETTYVVPTGQDAPEKLEVYYSDKLVDILTRIAKYETTWKKSGLIAPYTVASFNLNKMLPDHCTTLFGSTPHFRWQNIEDTALPIYYHEDEDATCDNTVAQIDDAISALNNNYAGLTVSNGGTHDFVPDCNSGATGTQFTSYIFNTYGDTRRHLIQFDDPCNEITNLSGCNGTLALGGHYGFSTTYTYLGETYRVPAYGNVIVNNGVGACQCDNSDYSIMITHEITHGLGFGHIPSGEGAANMNPSCCNLISNLDIECVDFIYPVMLPIELVDFSARSSDRGVDLNWSTYSEVNNDYFRIERSSNGKDFTPLAKINGSGTTYDIQEYTFIDQNPLPGISYYRLVQSDYDGTSENLEIVSVNIDQQFNFDVRPNPISGDNINLNFYSDSDSEILIEVYSYTGQLMISQYINKDSQDALNKIDATNLSEGIYIMRITQDGFTSSKKIVK